MDYRRAKSSARCRQSRRGNTRMGARRLASIRRSRLRGQSMRATVFHSRSRLTSWMNQIAARAPSGGWLPAGRFRPDADIHLENMEPFKAGQERQRLEPPRPRHRMHNRHMSEAPTLDGRPDEWVNPAPGGAPYALQYPLWRDARSWPGARGRARRAVAAHALAV